MKGYEEIRGKGSVSQAPGLDDAFGALFRSYRVESERLGHHVVIGGEGPPLLMLAGWPQCWYAWRHLMPTLARDFTLYVADPRGVCLSDLTDDGFDNLSLAADMFALMDALDIQRFKFLGHDIGMWTGFAMAKLDSARIRQLIVGEALVPGVSPSPPLLPVERYPSDLLSHFNFNRLRIANEELVRGREDIYFGHQFRTKAGSPQALSAEAQGFYVDLLRDPARLRASFEFYRALDLTIPQSRQLMEQPPIAIPVATYAGRFCVGDGVEKEWRQIATDVTSVVFENCGHYPAEEAPEDMLAFLTATLNR